MNIKPFWFFLLFAECALSYVPTADFIIDEMAKRCVVVSPAEVKLQGVITKKDVGPVDKSSADLVLKQDGLFVIKRSQVNSQKGAPTGNNAVLGAKESVALQILSELIECQSKTGASIEKLKAYLNKAHIDLKTVSLGFFAYEPVFIIGARPNDAKSPQLWIEKASFLPVKEVSLGRVTTFEKWSVINSLLGKKFPSIINTSIGDRLHSIAISEQTTTGTGG